MVLFRTHRQCSLASNWWVKLNAKALRFFVLFWLSWLSWGSMDASPGELAQRRRSSDVCWRFQHSGGIRVGSRWHPHCKQKHPGGIDSYLCECNAGQVSPKHVYVQIGNISQQQGCAIFHLLLGSRNRSPLKENGICCSGQLSFCGTLQTTVLLRKVTEYLHTCAHSQFDTGCIRALALAVWFR